MTVYVIPCCGEKSTTPAPARDFYLGSMFRHTLATAEALAGPGDIILVLSAWYGLVPLGRVLRPYEQRMDQDGAVDKVAIQSTFMLNVDHRHDVVAFLPRVYFDALDTALEDLLIWPLDCYEATCGIGHQRHVNVLATV